MLDINLIRWRSIQRQQHFSQLITGVIIAISLACLTLWLLYLFSVDDFEYQVETAQKNANLLTKIKLTTQIKKVTIADLRSYQQKYEKIQNIILRHSKTHQLFEILDKLLPEQVTLTEIQYQGDKLRLRGISYSNNDLSNFLIQLSQLTEFQHPQLNFSLQGENRNLKSRHAQNRHQNQTSKRFELQVLFLDDNTNTNASSDEHGIGNEVSNRSENENYKNRGE